VKICLSAAFRVSRAARGFGSVLLLALTGDTTSGYTGAISLGIQLGQINAG